MPRGRDFEPESHRVLDYAANYRHVRRRLEDAVVEVAGEGNEPCYPELVSAAPAWYRDAVAWGVREKREPVG